MGRMPSALRAKLRLPCSQTILSVPVRAEKMPDRSEEAPTKLETAIKDSVQLPPSAQARALRRAGQSIPQIATKLGLAIPTVAAFFEE